MFFISNNKELLNWNARKYSDCSIAVSVIYCEFLIMHRYAQRLKAKENISTIARDILVYLIKLPKIMYVLLIIFTLS